MVSTGRAMHGHIEASSSAEVGLSQLLTKAATIKEHTVSILPQPIMHETAWRSPIFRGGALLFLSGALVIP